jgi:ubiquinone/menaquinone biosynthesis C-methylase UbiE
MRAAHCLGYHEEMRMFLRKPTVERDPLPVTMSGVRLGERVLQIVGTGDARLAALIAAKVGMTGTAVIVVRDDRAAARANSAVADTGAVADVHVGAPPLPFDAAAFDVAVTHEAERGMTSSAERVEWLQECRRLLRDGGRIVAIETTTSRGLRALLPGGHAPDRADRQSGSAAIALQAAGFSTVRMLAEREGYRFIEGFKTSKSD